MDQLDNTELNEYRFNLINLVKQNSILWFKVNHRKQGKVAESRKIKTITWKAIAEQLGTTSAKVRRSWQNLRSQYLRDLKRQKTFGVEPKWHFFNEMDFIRSTIRFRGGELKYWGNESDELSCDETETIECSNQSYSTRTTNEAINGNDDADASRVICNSKSHLDDRIIQIETDSELECDKNDEGTSQFLQKISTNDLTMTCVTNTSDKIDQIIKIESDSECDNEAKSSIPAGANIEKPILSNIKLVPNSATSMASAANGPHSGITNSNSSLLDNAQSMRNSLTAENGTVTSECYTKTPRLLQAASDLEIQDEDYHFVISLLPSLRSVTRSKKFGLRVRIMSLINNELE